MKQINRNLGNHKLIIKDDFQTSKKVSNSENSRVHTFDTDSRHKMYYSTEQSEDRLTGYHTSLQRRLFGTQQYRAKKQT